MNEIRMVDLHGQYVKIQDEITHAMQDVINSTAFIKGQAVTDFQHELEAFLNCRHVIPVGNGTDALQLALMALGLERGDEVITPTFTFVATAEVIALLGLKPVFVDVNHDTFCIDTEQLERHITTRTKAIVPVHLFGQNADMETILNCAKSHDLAVIEDACQSIGAEYRFTDGSRKKSGCMGTIGCTSFFPSKNLGCYGDGGAVFTNDDTLADEIRCKANHGMRVRYHYDSIGINSRLDSIQAAILRVKLAHLDAYTEARQTAAAYYDELLADCQYLRIPTRSKQSSHVFHQYTIRLDACIDRDLVQNHLQEKGIPTMIYYPIPLHLQKAYRDQNYREGDFPHAEKLSKSVLSLPMHTELDKEQQEYICENLLKEIKICRK